MSAAQTFQTRVCPRLYFTWLCQDVAKARRALDDAHKRSPLSRVRGPAIDRANKRIDDGMAKLREFFSVPLEDLEIVFPS